MPDALLLEEARRLFDGGNFDAATMCPEDYSYLLEELVLRRASSPTSESPQWQPIEIAPKDGRVIKVQFAPGEADAKWGDDLWADGDSKAWVDPTDDLPWARTPVAWKPVVPLQGREPQEEGS